MQDQEKIWAIILRWRKHIKITKTAPRATLSSPQLKEASQIMKFHKYQGNKRELKEMESRNWFHIFFFRKRELVSLFLRNEIGFTCWQDNKIKVELQYILQP